MFGIYHRMRFRCVHGTHGTLGTVKMIKAPRTCACICTQEVLEKRCFICPICPLSHSVTHRPHLLFRASHHDIAADAARLAILKTKLLERASKHDAAELLRDIGTDDLQCHGYAEEFARLLALWDAEILADQLDL